MSSSQSKKCCAVQASKRTARPKEAIANVLGVNAADSGRTSGVSSSIFPFSVVIFGVGRERVWKPGDCFDLSIVNVLDVSTTKKVGARIPGWSCLPEVSYLDRLWVDDVYLYSCTVRMLSLHSFSRLRHHRYSDHVDDRNFGQLRSRYNCHVLIRVLQKNL